MQAVSVNKSTMSNKILLILLVLLIFILVINLVNCDSFGENLNLSLYMGIFVIAGILILRLLKKNV